MFCFIMSIMKDNQGDKKYELLLLLLCLMIPIFHSLFCSYLRNTPKNKYV